MDKNPIKDQWSELSHKDKKGRPKIKGQKTHSPKEPKKGKRAIDPLLMK
jgi:hypothetical protein